MMIEGVHLCNFGNASLTRQEAEKVVGKKVVGIVNHEFYLEIWVDDGTCLRARGNFYGGALDVEVEKE